jgi:hypothetical protein
MKNNRPKVDLGLVYSMYGGIGYPGYYMDPELSKELFRLMRYYFRRLWRSVRRSYRSHIANMEKRSIAFSNLL